MGQNLPNQESRLKGGMIVLSLFFDPNYIECNTWLAGTNRALRMIREENCLLCIINFKIVLFVL